MRSLATPPVRQRDRWAVVRAVAVLASPLVLALPCLGLVVEGARAASYAPLGRDQGIFQYVAWALSRGDVDYRDVRDVNGPLTHFIHRAFLACGGADEHRFRLLDLCASGVVFAFVGACLPGIGRRPPTWIERCAWALAGSVALGAQYLSYKYWDMAQRESFFDWFVLPSAALYVAIGGASASPRRRAGLIALVGALSVVPWFGKPTYAVFTLAQGAAILAPDRRAGEGHDRRRSTRDIGAFAAGGGAAAVALVAMTAAYGDALAYARIQIVDVPAMYRFIWPRSAWEILALPWARTPAVLAVAGAAVLVALITARQMPSRAIAVALLPVCGLANVIAQSKGFPYHFHPVTAGVHLQWLLFAAWLTGRCESAAQRNPAVMAAPVALGAGLAFRFVTALNDSPHIRGRAILQTPTDAERGTRAYFDRFAEVDFFPFEMRQAATYVRERTNANDRVQIYGMDPYLLFLAGRLSATPYLYAYDLNADAALAGAAAAHAGAEQLERIRAIRAAHEDDLVTRLAAHPPAAFVFFDAAPLLSQVDAWRDFESHSPAASSWVRDRYRETARFGRDRVWMRVDLAPTDGLPAPREAASTPRWRNVPQP